MPPYSVRCWLPVCTILPVSLDTFIIARASSMVSVNGFSQ